MTPEALARIHIDQLLQAAGWHVHDLKQANIHATTGVAIREFPLNPGHCVGKVSRLPIGVPSIDEQSCIVAEVDRQLSILRGVEAEVNVSLQRVHTLRGAVLAKSFVTV
jgi:type I restriction enzyme R subunit